MVNVYDRVFVFCRTSKNTSGHVGTRTCVAGLSRQTCYVLDHHASCLLRQQFNAPHSERHFSSTLQLFSAHCCSCCLFVHSVLFLALFAAAFAHYCSCLLRTTSCQAGMVGYALTQWCAD